MMVTFTCQCGNQLFFDNTRCIGCSSDVGWCEHCGRIVAVQNTGNSIVCTVCRWQLQRCANFAEHDVCNRYVTAHEADVNRLCASCQLTKVIPDLSVEGNLQKWRELESAKRRLLFELDALGLPYNEAHGASPPLKFRFAADVAGQSVATGHAAGVITINVKEADPVSREVARLHLGEPHRTLIGHLRHEIGHFYHLILVAHRQDEAFAQTFGDPHVVPYARALTEYYWQGPQANWSEQFISAYASSHPWEDFAETFNFYLDMRAMVRTAQFLLPAAMTSSSSSDVDGILKDYQRLGVVLNELNRVMGLMDVVPELVSSGVREKLLFVHSLMPNTPSGP